MSRGSQTCRAKRVGSDSMIILLSIRAMESVSLQNFMRFHKSLKVHVPRSCFAVSGSCVIGSETEMASHRNYQEVVELHGLNITLRFNITQGLYGINQLIHNVNL